MGTDTNLAIDPNATASQSSDHRPNAIPELDVSLARAHGAPRVRGRMRATPEDFRVVEDLGFEASGSGEHWFVTLTKRRRNTMDVARALARVAEVKESDVSFAGLKDRDACTTQTFSVQVPGTRTPDWAALEDDGLRIETVARHQKKLRRGSLRGNRFVLTLRDCEGDRDAVSERIAVLGAQGVPNYFGEQRFGRNGQNLTRAAQWLCHGSGRVRREQRSFLISAARSYLFNLVSSARVETGMWARALTGDVLMFEGSQSQIRFDASDPSIIERMQAGDLHVTGPLPGGASRALLAEHEAALLETAVLAPWEAWIAGLARARVEAARRPLRVYPQGLAAHWPDAQTLVLEFALPAGAYATTLLAELGVFTSAECTTPQTF